MWLPAWKFEWLTKTARNHVTITIFNEKECKGSDLKMATN